MTQGNFTNHGVKQEEQIDWRRNKVMELMCSGVVTQAELSRILQVPKSTINRDVQYLREQAKHNLANYTENFSFEFDKIMFMSNQIHRDAYELSKTSKWERNKILSLQLCREVLQFRMDCLTNVDVIMKASNWIEYKKKKLEHMVEQEEADNMIEIASGPKHFLPAPVDESERSSLSPTNDSEDEQPTDKEVEQS